MTKTKQRKIANMKKIKEFIDLTGHTECISLEGSFEEKKDQLKDALGIETDYECARDKSDLQE